MEERQRSFVDRITMRISTLHFKREFEQGSWLEAIQEIAIGVVTGLIRAWAVMNTWVYVNIIRPSANLIGVHLPEGKREKIPNGTLKVAALGFGRTGTFSVALAMEELGFPTLHTFHMLAYENEEILRMWSKLIVDPAIEKKEPIIGRADLKLIVDSGYQAVADLPSCLFFEQMLEEYPDCKFILTTRESSEIWFRSWSTLTKSVTGTMHLGGWLFPTLRLYSRYFRWLYAFINKDPSYLTSTIPKYENIKENAIASYEEHNRRVREVIPPNQLLEFNVKDGWEPICKFLEIEHCPTTPFPKSNSARSLQAQSSTAFWVVLIFLLFVASKLYKSFYKKNALKKKVD